VVVAVAVTLAGAALAGAPARFPESRPTSLAEALGQVAGPSAGCLTARVERLRGASYEGGPSIRSILAPLERRPLAADEMIDFGERLTVRFAAAAGQSPSRELLNEVRLGTDEARALFTDRLGLATPDHVEIVLLDLRPEFRGYLFSADGRSRRTVLGVSGAATETARRAVVHQYAHAVVALLGGTVAPGWSEAIATWAEIAAEGTIDPAAAALLSARLSRLSAGLFDGDPELAGGNALWLGFVEHAYGADAVRRILEGLTSEGTVAAAMERALRAEAAGGLAAAFREFQLWTLLTGPRSDEFHLPYARALRPPAYASTAEGLPALSVQADPAIGSWGATQVRIMPQGALGGLRIDFDGEFPGRWEADLLLFGSDGTKRRVAFPLSPEGRGAVTVPADEVAEALLLVRNTAGDEVPPRRYTYAVDHERHYPFEIATFEATSAPHGVALAWETSSEQDLAGFNLRRMREGGGATVTINPVLVPALGDLLSATAYHYLDTTAEPGVSYVYRVQGVTRLGLTRQSEPAFVRRTSR
jgi:hypothetical protein